MARTTEPDQVMAEVVHTVPAETDGVVRLHADSDPALKSEYNEFIDASPQGILFQHTWWLDTLAPDCYEIVVIRESGKIKAAWPLVYAGATRTGSVSQPQLTKHLGMLFEHSDAKYTARLSSEMRLMDTLLDCIPEDVGVKQNFHYDFTNWLPLHWRGYSQTTRYTYLIEDMSDMDTVWGDMHGDVRTKIRKAKKSGIVEKETDDVELFYSINSMSFARQGRSIPYDLDLVARIAEINGPNRGCRITIAEDSQGRTHACCLVVYDKQCTISLMGGADPDLRNSGAKPLLEWGSIQFAGAVSQCFDFEGSSMQQFEPYIRKFGGVQRTYFKIWRDEMQGSAPEAASQKRGMIRRFVRRVTR